MKRKIICDKHKFPQIFDTELALQKHMKEFHKLKYMEMLQISKQQKIKLQNKSQDLYKETWKEYYGDTK